MILNPDAMRALSLPAPAHDRRCEYDGDTFLTCQCGARR